MAAEQPDGDRGQTSALRSYGEEWRVRTPYFENQIFIKPIRAQLARLEPQQRTIGPLALVRSAEEHGRPHEAWFWDPTKQGVGLTARWNPWVSACGSSPVPDSDKVLL